MKRFLSSNRISLIDILGGLSLIVLLLILILFHFSPSDASLDPISPVIGYMMAPSSNDSYVMIDNGKSRVMGVENGRLKYTILVGSGEETFYQAENLYIDPSDGSIYVQSVDWDSSGYLLASERVLHYDSNGRYLSTPYTESYVPEDEVNQHRVFDPQIIAGKLYVVYADEKGVYQYRIENGEKVQTAFFEYENAWIFFQNFKQVSEGEVYGVDKRGYIQHLSASNIESVYKYSSEKKEVLFSVDVDSLGNVYYVDIYNGRVCRVTSQSESTVIADVANLYAGSEFAPGHDQMPALKIGQNGAENLFCFMLNERAVALDSQGKIIHDFSVLPLGPELRTRAIGVMVLFGLIQLLIIYFLLRMIAVVVVCRPHLDFIWKVEIGFAVFAIALTFFILTIMGNMFGTSYMRSEAEKLTDIAIAGSNSITADLVENIEEMSDFMGPEYSRLSRLLIDLTTRNHRHDRRYGAEIEILDEDGRAYCIAYVDNSIGVYYPMDSSTKAEMEYIYSTGEATYNLSQIAAGGSFIFGRAPITDDEGKVIGVLTIAQDSYREKEKLTNMVKHIMISVILLVIIIMFLINEVFSLLGERDNFRKGRAALIGDRRIPLHITRIAAFSVSFVLNMTSSFLSVYTSSFWSESLGISPSLAGAIPLFANGLFIALSALFCPALLIKLGFFGLMTLGVLCSGLGDLLAGLSSGYVTIVLALLLNGLGFGILINTLSITIGRIDDEGYRKNGYAQFNAGCIAGINCGMIFGSVLVSVIRYNQVFFLTSALWILSILIFIYLGKSIPPIEQRKKEKKTHGSISLQAVLYAAMVAFPYAVAGSFMYFYLPLFVTSLGYSEEYVSILMMIYAACGIFLGKVLTKYMWMKLKQWSVFVAIVMVMAAWMLIVTYPSMDIVAIAMLMIGISFSFGLNVTMSAYLEGRGVAAMRQEDAVGIYEFSSRAGQCLSSIICGLMMGAGIIFGMGTFSVISIVLFLLYELIYRNRKSAAVQV